MECFDGIFRKHQYRFDENEVDFSIHGVGYQSVEAVTLFKARTADAFIIVNACVCPFWVFVYQFLKIPLLYGKAVQLFVMIR